MFRRSVLFFLLFFPLKGSSWGFKAHKNIAEKSIYLLPPEIFSFYKKNRATFIEKSVSADKRRYSNKNEAPRHYFDVDFYENDGFPIKMIPLSWEDAVTIIGVEKINDYGKVLWQVHFTYVDLIAAFREKNAEKIIRVSGDLTHYISDACVPLHATSNYNGQKTNQKGIHSLWETIIPKKYMHEYSFFFEKREKSKKVKKLIQETITESYELSKKVLEEEAMVTEKFGIEKKFSPRAKKRTYSSTFVKEYATRMNLMIESRMRKAVDLTALFITQAWKKAGKPVGFTKKVLASTKGKKNKKQDQKESPVLKGHIE